MSNNSLPILPGQTLGILGGGQLGRMFVVAARTLGYRIAVLDPDPASPAGRIADLHIRAGYDDQAALAQLADSCAAITTEFENVPAASLTALASVCRVTPAAEAVAIAQDRACEKSWLAERGFATAPFVVVQQEADLDAALRQTGTPALLKVARLGYDGKGQARVASVDDARAAFREFGGVACVLEGFVRLDREVSVVLARNDLGESALFPVAENRHANGILDVSLVPARIPAELARDAQSKARAIADALGYIGVMAVEFFVVDGQLLVNEVAPRPHNSGHYTLEACVTDQFEQQVRSLAGLPLGDTRLLSPVAMVNLLGDRWQRGDPAWGTLFAHPNVKLHLYGKDSARPGRKMGHFSVLDADPDAALRLAEALSHAL
ncbi:MAG: 5-(carboxyamino)imidazole ribonucleotide synthase [Hydrogenophilales bacterium 16-64-46]|nr:MAG: 5-(carboxyamino)imidazole ribonucleotide synthase [Hydrogenophilales bacterium 12-64-13]OYZ05225.1 MAG: 5-(carboxyamino)imidazole ribonucleotide synthase [Hydrogenophilales bacterium 16-64-46]OZA37040.1 MAG: 5-(carboxyamino)imidazole ribonucleotide synthase [Hydrogenophilales bacterium 17-64-34]HQS99926.1 5-(carboxyamino)imidazole ribonucleotide synthase [Thiobacillus sp.]